VFQDESRDANEPDRTLACDVARLEALVVSCGGLLTSGQSAARIAVQRGFWRLPEPCTSTTGRHFAWHLFIDQEACRLFAHPRDFFVFDPSRYYDARTTNIAPYSFSAANELCQKEAKAG
jgi:hypothetical protein